MFIIIKMKEPESINLYYYSYKYTFFLHSYQKQKNINIDNIIDFLDNINTYTTEYKVNDIVKQCLDKNKDNTKYRHLIQDIIKKN